MDLYLLKAKMQRQSWWLLMEWHDGDQQYPLFVDKITSIRVFQTDTMDIFFKCVGLKYQYDESDGPGVIFDTILLSSAFRSRWMYSSFNFGDQLNDEDKHAMVIKGFIGTSPDYIDLNQLELEMHYVNIRLIMSNYAIMIIFMYVKRKTLIGKKKLIQKVCSKLTVFAEWILSNM